MGSFLVMDETKVGPLLRFPTLSSTLSISVDASLDFSEGVNSCSPSRSFDSTGIEVAEAPDMAESLVGGPWRIVGAEIKLERATAA